MVYVQKHLVVFGGFHDNLQSFQYFNDVHALDLERRQWKKLDVTGQWAMGANTAERIRDFIIDLKF